MTKIAMTAHAQRRKQQRGFRDADIAIVLQTARQVAPDAYMLTRADAAHEIEKRKREIQQLERLIDTKIIIEGDIVITCYHALKREQKRTMRKEREFQ
jgi:hypothetical protein